MKNPWIAASLNFVFYGGGYIYAGKKKALGYGLLLVFVIMSIEFVMGNIGHIEDPISTHSISMTFLAVVLAYDAYSIVKR